MKFIDKIMRELGYMPIPKKGTIRICQECGSQIKRGHRWHLWEGLPKHYFCEIPTTAPVDLPKLQEQAKDDGLQQIELELFNNSIMNAVKSASLE